jgi:hypothetical protein
MNATKEPITKAMTPTIQDAMSEMLNALGFERMAQEVRTEDDLSRLRQYARIIVKQSPSTTRDKVANLFRMYRPSLF